MTEQLSAPFDWVKNVWVPVGVAVAGSIVVGAVTGLFGRLATLSLGDALLGLFLIFLPLQMAIMAIAFAVAGSREGPSGSKTLYYFVAAGTGLGAVVMAVLFFPFYEWLWNPTASSV